MIASVIDILKNAQQNSLGVPAINVDNDLMVMAAIEAAEEANLPIILQTTPYGPKNLEYFSLMVKYLADQTDILIGLNLDHAKSFSECIQGIRYGFTNIMFDGSLLPFEENINQTRKITEIAHSIGVTVEAELGHVGVGRNYQPTVGLTNVIEAKKFVDETQVDSLAIAIGTAHGHYLKTPKLDFDLLINLRKSLSLPLVLHGGSGSGLDNLIKARDLGIQKFNLSNDLRKAAGKEIQSLNLEGNDAYQIFNCAYDGFKAEVKRYLNLLGRKHG